MSHQLHYKLGKHLPQPPAMPKTSQMPSGEVLTELARKTRLVWGNKSTYILLIHLLTPFPISKPCGDAAWSKQVWFSAARGDDWTHREPGQLGELAGARRLLAAGNRVKTGAVSRELCPQPQHLTATTHLLHLKWTWRLRLPKLVHPPQLLHHYSSWFQHPLTNP